MDPNKDRLTVESSYTYQDPDGDRLTVHSLSPTRGLHGVRLGVTHETEVLFADVLAEDVPAVVREMYERAGLDRPQWTNTPAPVTCGDLREALAPVLASLENLHDRVLGHFKPSSPRVPIPNCGERKHLPGVTGSGLWVWCELDLGHPSDHLSKSTGASIAWCRDDDTEPGL